MCAHYRRHLKYHTNVVVDNVKRSSIHVYMYIDATFVAMLLIAAAVVECTQLSATYSGHTGDEQTTNPAAVRNRSRYYAADRPQMLHVKASLKHAGAQIHCVITISTR